MEKIEIELKWAFIFFLASLLWMVLEKVSGLHGERIGLHPYLSMLFMIPAVWIYVLALKEKNTKYFGGSMDFKSGMTSGMIISIILTLLAPLTQWIAAEFISPEYFSNVIEYSVKEGHYSTVEEAKSYFNLKSYIWQSMVGALISGTLISIVVVYFLRRNSQAKG
ncbi:MAG: DUF4199 domain-containing protein [Saprospiraceae bacterium]|nr:DUF4199 domain-containing protein [Saprospiraceae bacterium]